jgi:hypothetical protein
MAIIRTTPPPIAPPINAVLWPCDSGWEVVGADVDVDVAVAAMAVFVVFELLEPLDPPEPVDCACLNSALVDSEVGSIEVPVGAASVTPAVGVSMERV